MDVELRRQGCTAAEEKQRVDCVDSDHEHRVAAQGLVDRPEDEIYQTEHAEDSDKNAIIYYGRVA